MASLPCPGHPLVDSTATDLVIKRHRDLLRRGTVVVDDRDVGVEVRMLLYLEHAIQDASTTRAGTRRVVSKRMLYVEIDPNRNAKHLAYVPYLDYGPLQEEKADIEKPKPD